MKRKVFLFSLLLVIILAGCAKKDNIRAEDGSYFYSNKDLGFSLVLPPEFEYYQTQRINTNNYIDIEIFTPTSDTDYYQEVQSYAKPIVIRVFNKDYYETKENEKNLYEKVGETNDKFYGIRFWEKIPNDWKGKWSDEMREKILNNFKLI